MESLEVLIARKDGAQLPGYATDASSGVDLCAFIEEPIVLKPLERSLVPTGIFISIPERYSDKTRRYGPEYTRYHRCRLQG
jgi:dUTP pyrophosphatase